MNKANIPAAQHDALAMLMDDHRAVKKLFSDFEKEKSASAKEAIVREACMELTVHTQVEEQLFYPFLESADKETFGDLLDEAEVEHAGAKNLIAELETMSSSDELFRAKFTVLGEYIVHHVGEEEGELFPKVISKKVDLRELAVQMRELKEELMAQAGQTVA
jgi:hemerythrin superfamily protein